MQNIFHSQECEQLSPWERRSFTSSHSGPTLVDVFWENLYSTHLSSVWSISTLTNSPDLRGIHKTLIWVYRLLSLSPLDFGIRYESVTGKYLIQLQLPLCHPHKTPLMYKQSQRILWFKPVDSCILVNVSFRRRNGLHSQDASSLEKLFFWMAMYDFYQVAMKKITFPEH